MWGNSKEETTQNSNLHGLWPLEYLYGIKAFYNGM